METFSVLLVLCVGNSPVTSEFTSQRPVTRCFDDLFDLRLNKRLSKQSRRRWFETPSHSLRRHGNACSMWYAYGCVVLCFVAVVLCILSGVVWSWYPYCSGLLYQHQLCNIYKQTHTHQICTQYLNIQTHSRTENYYFKQIFSNICHFIREKVVFFL